MDFSTQFKAISALLAVFLLYKLWLGKPKSKLAKGKKAPEPAGAWPIIGHLHQLAGTEPLTRTIGTMADKYGPGFMLRLGMRRTFVVCGWEIAKDCFTTNDKVLATRPKSASGDNMSYNYAMFGFSPYGAYWREMRKIATLELLSNRRLDTLKHVRVGEIDECMKGLYRRWVENGRRPVQVEMKQRLFELTFNVLIMMIVGKRFFGDILGGTDEAEAIKIRQLMERSSYLSGVFVLSDVLPFLKSLDLQGHEKAMRGIAAELDSLISTWLKEHRQKRLCGETNGEQDFMDVMVSTLESAQISSYDPDTIIKATSQILIEAGTDTTAVALAWGISLLINHPDVVKKAQAEVDTHVGQDRNVDDSDIKNLPYIQAIVKETLRLYPPAPLAIPHMAMEDCQIGGYHVPKGTHVMLNLWRLQRDPSVWAEPDEFRPERFFTTHVGTDVRGQHFELLPFGSGRRSCPGQALAIPVLQLTLARLIHGFDFSTPKGGPIDMTERLHITLNKANLVEVMVSPRLPSKLYE
ncbi:hypothetical protein ACLOJK_041204 [Asimina triloba]